MWRKWGWKWRTGYSNARTEASSHPPVLTRLSESLVECSLLILQTFNRLWWGIVLEFAIRTNEDDFLLKFVYFFYSETFSKLISWLSRSAAFLICLHLFAFAFVTIIPVLDLIIRWFQCFRITNLPTQLTAMKMSSPHHIKHIPGRFLVDEVSFTSFSILLSRNVRIVLVVTHSNCLYEVWNKEILSSCSLKASDKTSTSIINGKSVLQSTSLDNRLNSRYLGWNDGHRREG